MSGWQQIAVWVGGFLCGSGATVVVVLANGSRSRGGSMSWLEERRAERRWRKHNAHVLIEGRCHCGRPAVVYVALSGTVGRVPCLSGCCEMHPPGGRIVTQQHMPVDPEVVRNLRRRLGDGEQ